VVWGSEASVVEGMVKAAAAEARVDVAGLAMVAWARLAAVAKGSAAWAVADGAALVGVGEEAGWVAARHLSVGLAAEGKDWAEAGVAAAGKDSVAAAEAARAAHILVDAADMDSAAVAAISVVVRGVMAA
jgi:hypothetical protein